MTHTKLIKKCTNPNCGAENSNRNNFCDACGFALPMQLTPVSEQQSLIGGIIDEDITPNVADETYPDVENETAYNSDNFEDFEPIKEDEEISIIPQDEISTFAFNGLGEAPEEPEDDDVDNEEETDEENSTGTSLTTTYVVDNEKPECGYEDIAHDDEFMDSIAETPKKKLNPEQTKARRKAIEVRNDEIVQSLVKHQTIAELLNHKGLKMLITDLQDSCVTDIMGNEIKDAEKSLKALKSVLDVKSLLGGHNVRISQLENEMKSNDREMQDLGSYQKGLFDDEQPEEIDGEVIAEEIIEDQVEEFIEDEQEESTEPFQTPSNPNLCDTCVKCYPECNANEIIFADDSDEDEGIVAACDTYKQNKEAQQKLA